MKKAVIVIGIIITFLILYFLQANIFTWFTIAKIMPNLFIIFVLFIGLFAGKYLGVTFGVVFGLFIDFFIGKKIGISSIMLAIIGLLGGYFDKNFSKESRITMMLMVAGSTIIFELGCFVINAVIYSYAVEGMNLLITLIIEIIYNVIITIILYPIMERTGFYIEDAFKGNKILTRYF